MNENKIQRKKVELENNWVTKCVARYLLEGTKGRLL